MEEAETKIRQVAKDEFFKQTRKTAIDRKVYAIIRETMAQIKIPDLRRAAEVSLLEFYNRQYRELRRSFSWQLPMVAALALLNGHRTDGTPVKVTTREQSAAWRTVEAAGYSGARVMGVPMQRFSQDYIRENVQPALDRLAKQYPYDPDSMGEKYKTETSYRQSLRNRAESEVRYRNTEDSIASLRSQGVKLVIISTHADCSERCRKAQGGVYSLDGTSGRTDDGRTYEPLENVTDIPVITKSGKVYPRGYGILYGFGCRHFAVPYKTGYYFPEPNAAEEEKEYMITETQRRLERNVRDWRTVAVENKGVNHDRYVEARAKAIEWNKRYIEYSQKNNRAYYPSRTKIL